eukprot:Nk52_evm65s153 gene=Nk52_evmTU65s153
MPNSKRRNAVKLRLKDKAVPSRFLRVEAPKEWYSSSVENFLLYNLHVHHKDDPDPVGSMLSQLRAHRRNSVDAVRYEVTREDLQIQHYNVCHLNVSLVRRKKAFEKVGKLDELHKQFLAKGRELADLVQSLEDDEDEEFHQMLNEKASYLKYNFRSKLDFVLEQTELMVKSSALKEWASKISFNVAFVLYSSSPGAYLQLLSTGCLYMPSVRTICRFNQDHHGMSTDEFGHDNESNVKYVRNRVNADREECEKKGILSNQHALVFDGLHIQASTKFTGEGITGISDNTDKHGNKHLANEALGFMCFNPFSKFRHTMFYKYVKAPTAAQIAIYISFAFFVLLEAGIRGFTCFSVIICDGLRANIAAYNAVQDTWESQNAIAHGKNADGSEDAKEKNRKMYSRVYCDYDGGPFVTYPKKSANPEKFQQKKSS